MSKAIAADQSSEFDPEFFDLLARLEGRNFWFRERNRLIVSALGRLAPDARSFLEAGCGTGFVLQGLAAARPHLALTGGELFGAGLVIARERVPHATLVELDARDLPYRSEFDAVGAFDVIEHVDEDTAVIEQLCLAVHPGGLVLVTVPQHRWLWSAADDAARHRRRYKRSELVSKVQAAGLEVEQVSSFVTFLLPVMAVARLRARNDYDLARELAVPRALDRVFGALLRAEVALIARGVSLPAGGSLFLAARRPA